MPPRKPILAAGALLLALFLAFGDPGGVLSARMDTVDDRFAAQDTSSLTGTELGALYFTVGDWGGLSSDTLQTSASPWRLSTTLIALNAVGGDPEAVGPDVLRAEFQSFGMPSPSAIANWPEGMAQPDFDAVPLGQVAGHASRLVPPLAVTIGNGACAMCHSSVTYDRNGTPNPDRVWIGAANSSINLQAYVAAIYDGFLAHGGEDREDALFDAMRRLHPDMSARESLTLRHVILPRFRTALEERRDMLGALLPFQASTAGATNGLDTLRQRLGLIPHGARVERSTFNSVPDLGGRLLRDRFLNTGAYRIPGRTEPRVMTRDGLSEDHRRALGAIIAYFTVPSLGVDDSVAVAHVDRGADVAAWMESYRPAPFPGSVDMERARAGEALYTRYCASCHGEYAEREGRPTLVSFPNVATETIGTDPARLGQFTTDMAMIVNGSRIGDYIDAAPTTAYSAPPLDGIWSSAPYLHNGSVPTLQALFGLAERPEIFSVGGHALDLDAVGIRLERQRDGVWGYPGDHVPWSRSETIDTRLWGQGNGGHTAQFAPLSDAQKRDLIEYLKRL